MSALHIMAKRRPVSSNFQARKGRVFAMVEMVGIGKNIPIDSGSNEEQNPGDTFVVAIIKIRL